MNTSPELKTLLPALIKARAKFTPLTKRHTVKIGAYSYQYADLASLLEATMPALLEQGLILTQAPHADEQGFCLVSRLSHTSGEFIETRYPLKVYDKPQEQGSAITYARRYAAAPLLGIAAEDDDDGAQASNATTPPQTVVPMPPSGYQSWIDDLTIIAKEQGAAVLQDVWKHSNAGMRRYLTTHQSAIWERIKASAAKVTP
jgi:hypothetical protein